jgi:hypothetical protein
VQISQDPIEIQSRDPNPSCDNPSLLNQAALASAGGSAAASAGGDDLHKRAAAWLTEVALLYRKTVASSRRLRAHGPRNAGGVSQTLRATSISVPPQIKSSAHDSMCVSLTK